MSTALTLTIGNISAAIGTNIFLGAEAPRYPTGYGISIVSWTIMIPVCNPLITQAVLLSAIIAAGSLWYLCAKENTRRDSLQIEQSPEELEHMGDKSPYYRYIM